VSGTILEIFVCGLTAINGFTAPSFLPFFTGFAVAMILYLLFCFRMSVLLYARTNAIGTPKLVGATLVDYVIGS
jgi:cell division protein FtsX